MVVVAHPAMGTRTLPNGESPERGPEMLGPVGGLPVPPPPNASPLVGEGWSVGDPPVVGAPEAGADAFGLVAGLGRGDGRGVGPATGLGVGLAVGFAVGWGVGFGVGLGVGAGVGDGVGALTLIVDGLTVVRVADLAPAPDPLVAVKRYAQVPAGSRRLVEKVTPEA
jgi:hypothetical protein